MAGRWRSAQRRKRWTDHAALLPEGALSLLKGWPALQPLAEQLDIFGQQPSTYAQLMQVKSLGNNLLAVLDLSEEEVRVSLKVFVELLFVENSRPLHRGLLSTLSRVPPDHAVSLRIALEECCHEYGWGGEKERWFSVVAVSASLTSLPQPGVLKQAADYCASSMGKSLCHDVQLVLQHALEGGRPTPTDMEECQDALSSLYYLLQQFPDKFYSNGFLGHAIANMDLAQTPGGQITGQIEVKENSESFLCGDMREISKPFALRVDGECELDDEKSISKESASGNLYRAAPERELKSGKEAGDIYGAIVSTLLDVLQTAVLSRDCLVAAGVGLAAAAQLLASNAGLAVLLASTAFPSLNSTYAVLSENHGLVDAKEEQGILEAAVIACRNSTLRAEMEKLAEFGKLCVYRGFLTAIPRNVQNFHLLRTSYFLNTSGFVVTARQQLVVGDKEYHGQAWTLLYDGILPALCGFCESSVDSHFKFHAVTAMQICLQQMKTSICGGHLTLSAFKHFHQAAVRHSVSVQPYDPLPAARVSQILQLIWNNWEDPLTQTVKQVQVVFDLLIDLRLVHKREMYDSQLREENLEFGESKKDDLGTDKFLRQIASDLLAAGRYRKGKYVPLASLVLRIGARKMLLMSPDLLFQTVYAFSDDDVCSSASTFLKTCLERLKEDCWVTDGVIEGTVVARQLWIPAVLSGLLTGDPRLRNNITTYALPVAMQIDSDSLLVILAYILGEHSKAGITAGSSMSWKELEGAHGLPGCLSLEQQVIVLISVLKVARSLGLVEGSIELKGSAEDISVGADSEAESHFSSTIVAPGASQAIFCVKGQTVDVPISLLLLALTHKEDGLRVDTAELMCLNPKTASMPSQLELCLLRIALPLNMRCSSTAFRMRWTSFLKKFFLRVRTAVERQQKTEMFRKSEHIDPPSSFYCVNGGEKVSSAFTSIDVNDNGEELGAMSAVTVERMQDFMQWLSQVLVSSLYPSAPYERKNMAMEVLSALIEVWSLEQSLGKRSGRYTSSPYLGSADFSPYHVSFLSVDFTLVVVGAVVDSWDRLREGAYRILVRYPTPLPGLDSEQSIVGLLKWAKGMVNSPRVRESDAGALAFRLIFRKYVLELGWSVKVHHEPKVIVTSTLTDDRNSRPVVGEMVVQYVESLNDWLQWGIEEGDKDLLKACTHSFVHGVLLVLRYTVEEIDWTSAASLSCSENLRAAFARLLNLLLRVTSIALWVVSADALNLQEKLGGSLPSDSMIPENCESDVNAADIEAVDAQYDSDSEGSLAPAEQMVMVGCWLSVKEVSLLLGTMARVVPLQGTTSNLGVGGSGTQQTRPTADTSKSSAMLDGKQLKAIGSHFVQVLLSMKHNGAIDKTRTGFIALCDRLLRSSDPGLNKLPEIWLQQLMEHACAKGQVVDDLLRRSAGIPPAFLALFLAEPEGAPKKLLPIAMRSLIDTCKGFVAWSSDQCQWRNGLESKASEEDCFLQRNLVAPDCISLNVDGLIQDGENSVALKSRDEGVVPTVHAFNILRMAFHDTNLATDTSGFCAEGLITAIQAFASPYWEIRNSATLTFTALVHRTIGFLNVYKRESARRAITGFEFFHRYPALHPFLLKELQSATWQLEHGTCHRPSEEIGLASSLHPSLGPVLIILSRLKPSFINSNVEDWLNPSAFLPYVTQCATQKNLHVRVLASRALAPLVTSEDLPGVLRQLAESLPVSGSNKRSMLLTSQQGLEVNPTGRASLGVDVARFDQVFTFNAIHGVLLQMCALLTANYTSIPDMDLCSEIVSQVTEAVEERVWLGSIRRCGCFMVISAFLDMLGSLLSLADVCQNHLANPHRLISRLQTLLTELSSQCLDDSSQEQDLGDSTRVGLREKAARIYFETMLTQGPVNCLDHIPSQNCIMEKNSVVELYTPDKRKQESELCADASASRIDDKFALFTMRLKHALVDHSYEVRLATLKVLKKYSGLPATGWKHRSEALGFSGYNSSLWDFRFLRPLIISRLSVETHPRCIQRILQVIYAWALINGGESDTPVSDQGCPTALNSNPVWDSSLSAQDLWCSLLKIYKTSKRIKTREVVVRCLGGCLRQICGGMINWIVSSELSKQTTHAADSQLLVYAKETGATKGAPLDGIDSVSQIEDGSGIKKVISTWLGIARIHSVASEPVNFRRATAEAIIASGLLEYAKEIGLKLAEELVRETDNVNQAGDLECYAKAVLSAWCICIKLLEDEDLELRQKLALSILNVVASSNLQTRNIVPAQVEKVIQISFEFLSLQFGHWREYYDFLAEWVLGTEDDTYQINGDADLVRRLFDKEIDNHHEEALLCVQICCVHLKKLMDVSCQQGVANCGLPSTKSKGELLLSNCRVLLWDGEKWPNGISTVTWYGQFLWKWRLRCLRRTISCAQLSVQIKDSLQWVGGVTNHQDSFKSLYRSLLGLFVFAGPRTNDKCLVTQGQSCDEKELLTGLTKLSGLLGQLQLNPLISNALVLVLQTYEEQLRLRLGSSEIKAKLGSAFYMKFEPLFLVS